MVRIIYHREKCIGCNGCVEAAPERWRISKRDGRSHLIEGKAKKGIYQVLVSDEEYEANVRAAVNCPARIIKVEQVP
ncbi:MAG: ferredoxin [Saprospiraceae bacterium]|nr:ferredoxin [Saprospiraceae bacterium]MCB9313031.1 ferredoxin [Lewinellaceae bacterium]HRW75566.1 ferredoxin [Saprospiraceae bacterium]